MLNVPRATKVEIVREMVNKQVLSEDRARKADVWSCNGDMDTREASRKARVLKLYTAVSTKHPKRSLWTHLVIEG